MHLPTHILSGWCIGNCFKLTARERLFCTIAASVADIDGVGRLVSEEAYWRFHHIAGHNLFCGLIIAFLLASFSQSILKTFLIYLALFHLHLYMDYWGSGPGWAIHYFWPIADVRWRNPEPWEFSSWQNTLTFGALALWAVAIAIVKRRTPLELIAPRLDRISLSAFGLSPQPR